MRSRLLTGAAVLLGSLSLISFATAQPGAATSAPLAATAAAGTPVAGATRGVPARELAKGQAMFVASCAACHGMRGTGIAGRAPSLRGVGALAADFYLQTGRMPLPSPRVQPMRTRPAYPQAEIRALVAYVGSLGGPAIPTVDPRRGSLADGERLFAIDCAGCHTIQAQGGIVTGAVVPSLNQATPRQVAEAIRIGPYVMPRFGASEISDAQIESIDRYVQSTQHPTNRGGWGLGRIGPIPEGMVAWLLGGTALLLITRLLGERIGDERPARTPREER